MLLRNTLYPFQRRAAKRAYRQGIFAFLMDTGTGKTITTLAVIARLFRRQSVRVVLVVGPKNALGQWRVQIKRHLAVKHDILDHSQIRDPRDLLRYGSLVFVLVNYEQTWRRIKLFEALPLDIIVLDESHRIKKPTARQTKACHRIAARVQNRYILTATPTDGRDPYIDLWSQFSLLRPDILGDLRSFRHRFKPVGPGGFKRVVKKHQANRIERAIAPYCFQISKHEALDLPPEVDMEIPVELTGDAKRVYEDLERDFYFEHGDVEITTPLMITQMIKLQTICGGWVRDDDDRLIKLNQDKLNMFADWFRDWGPKKLAIAAAFTPEIDEIEQLVKQTGRTVGVIDGRCKRPADVWVPFQEKRNPEVIIVEPHSGGISIDLFAADTMLVYSTRFSYIDYHQLRGRLSRDGQLAQRVTFIHMLVKNSIDTDRYYSLQDKGHTADKTLNRIRRRYQHGS